MKHVGSLRTGYNVFFSNLFDLRLSVRVYVGYHGDPDTIFLFINR